MVTRSDIQKILSNIEIQLQKMDKRGLKYFRKMQDRLILNLYYLIPPLRNDYPSVLVYKTIPKKMDINSNYIVLKNKNLYLNAYKTDGKYGQIIIKIPKEIIKIIDELFKFRIKEFPKLKNVRYLLINNDLKQMSNVNLIHNLNSIFRKSVSVTMLRKSYISEKYPGKTIEEMQQDAKIMGHSVTLQQSTYRKKI